MICFEIFLNVYNQACVYIDIVRNNGLGVLLCNFEGTSGNLVRIQRCVVGKYCGGRAANSELQVNQVLANVKLLLFILAVVVAGHILSYSLFSVGLG